MLLTVGGHELFYERAGAGRPLVLLHGLGTPSVWDRVFDPLSTSFDVIRVHLPGFGSSPPAVMSASEHAALVAGLLDRLGLEDVTLCGLSYGGQVAAMLAASTSRVGTLVLAAPSGLLRRYRFLRFAAIFAAVRVLSRTSILRNAASVRRWNRRLYVDPANQPEEVVAEFMRMLAEERRAECWFGCLRNAAVPEEGFPERLQSIHVPTLLVWGDRDRVLPSASAARFLRAIPGSRLEILGRCGHALPLERADQLIELLRGFARPRS